MKSFVLNCKNLNLNPVNYIKSGRLSLRLSHNKDDPANVNRIMVYNKDLVIEILPSKGLSIGQAWNNEKAIFWEPAIGMPDPDLLNLNSDEIAINGKPHSGFTFLKTFTGGVELYGLKNWGMPKVDEKGKLLPIHGETSNIPVEEIAVTFDEEKRTVKVKAEFYYNSYKGDEDKLWYLRGEKLIKIIRHIVIKQENEPTIELYDTFENISNSPFFIDWGYHITILPEKGARIIIPSKKIENRSGEYPLEDIETWNPAIDPKIRTEVGIIHKDLKMFTEKRTVLNKVLFERPKLGDIVVSFKPSPYMQSWMCNGGAYSPEFTFVKTKEPVFNKNWDGMGIEIGASALDHNRNTDPDVPVSKPVQPNKKITNYILIKIINRDTYKDMAKDFAEYSSDRSN
jgi:hypothetical protein